MKVEHGGLANAKQIAFTVFQKQYKCSLTLLKAEEAPANLELLLESGPETNFRLPVGEAVSLFQALLILSDGPTFALTPATFDERDAGDCDGNFQTEVVERWRSELADGNDPDSAFLQVCKTRLPGAKDILYLPLPAHAGGDIEVFQGVLLAFVVPRGSAWLAKDCFLHHKLPLILDLDETLVAAKSLAQLDKMLNEATHKRRQIVQKLQGKEFLPTAERSVLEVSLRCLQQEEKALIQDRKHLVEFMKTDAVTFGGVKQMARVEPVEGVPGIPDRPVLRAPEEGVIFTRINPMETKTSMLIRTRPGWEELKAAILGVLPSRHQQVHPQRPKFDVFVCTTAERQYAEEVWRLLDPTHQIAPRRIVCVDRAGGLGVQQKTLAAALDIGVGGGPGVPMSLALIADDRQDVWEADARGQVLFVEPFVPWSRAKDLYDELIRNRREGIMVPWLSLAPLMDRIRNIRSHVFFDRDQVMKLRELHEPESRTLVWPRVRSISDLNQMAEVPFRPSLPGGRPHIVVQLPIPPSKLKQEPKLLVGWGKVEEKNGVAHPIQRGLSFYSNALTASAGVTLSSQAMDDFQDHSSQPSHGRARRGKAKTPKQLAKRKEFNVRRMEGKRARKRRAVQAAPQADFIGGYGPAPASQMYTGQHTQGYSGPAFQDHVEGAPFQGNGQGAFGLQHPVREDHFLGYAQEQQHQGYGAEEQSQVYAQEFHHQARTQGGQSQDYVAGNQYQGFELGDQYHGEGGYGEVDEPLQERREETNHQMYPMRQQPQRRERTPGRGRGGHRQHEKPGRGKQGNKVRFGGTPSAGSNRSRRGRSQGSQSGAAQHRAASLGAESISSKKKRKRGNNNGGRNRGGASTVTF